MANGKPNVGKNFTLKVDGSALVHCESFNLSNSKGEIDYTSRDSNGNKEFTVDGLIERTISFTQGTVRNGTNAGGMEGFELLDSFYDADASMSFVIYPDSSGNHQITGWGYLTGLDIDFGSITDKVMATGTFRVNDASYGTR
jgi:hypothetical protein